MVGLLLMVDVSYNDITFCISHKLWFKLRTITVFPVIGIASEQ